MKIVEVVWDDAFCSTGDISAKKAATLKPIRTHTIGYLMAENEHGIIMVSDRYVKEKGGKMYNLIPHGMVVEVYVWE